MSQDLLCQSKVCEEVNFADVFCKDCDIRLCYSCDHSLHQPSGGLHKHLREPFTLEGSSGARESLTAKQTSSTSIINKQPSSSFEGASLPTKISKEIKKQEDSPSSSGKKGKKKGRKQQQRVDEEEEGSKESSPGEEGEEREEGSWSPTESDGFEGPLPDIAQMSVDPPNNASNCSGDDFETAQFESLSSNTKTKSAEGKKKTEKTSNGKIPNNNEGKSKKMTSKPVTFSSSSSDQDDDKIQSSFLVLDENEQMQINSADDFAKKLGASSSSLVKVVSIFGNTGEGKSHTLNFTFFEGKEVFKTSSAQSSCTIGIWAAYDRKNKIICIDTEGLLGVSENNNRRTRLLLKVLAISDIIIYRTRAERLHNDLFTFLGDASRAYGQHFHTELREASKRSGQCYTPTDLGPVVVVFHETIHTKILQRNEDKSPEDELRRRFQSLNLTTDSYSAFEYIGTQTPNPPTTFKGLQGSMRRHLNNTTVRSARKVSIVFGALKVGLQCFVICLYHSLTLFFFSNSI